MTTSDNDDIYRAPEADLQAEGGDTTILQFKRFSAWGVFFLGVITLGIYNVYWLYDRGKTVNEVHQDTIPPGMLLSPIILFVLTFVLSFISAFSESATIAMVETLLNLVYLVLYLVLLFKVRNRLQDIMGRSLNGILTFFFSSIYLQYKINQAIDELNQA